jgi:hypothetical protein
VWGSRNGAAYTFTLPGTSVACSQSSSFLRRWKTSEKWSILELRVPLQKYGIISISLDRLETKSEHWPICSPSSWVAYGSEVVDKMPKIARICKISFHSSMPWYDTPILPLESIEYLEMNGFAFLPSLSQGSRFWRIKCQILYKKATCVLKRVYIILYVYVKQAQFIRCYTLFFKHAPQHQCDVMSRKNSSLCLWACFTVVFRDFGLNRQDYIVNSFPIIILLLLLAWLNQTKAYTDRDTQWNKAEVIRRIKIHV